MSFISNFTVVLCSTFCLIAEPTKQLSTFEPVTQNRDKAIYDWAKRHQQVLELGKAGSVDVVLLGDSILHYWAGAPAAPIVRGQDAWDGLFTNKKAANLGFGWDRVENALWRVQNGELDGLKPSTVVILLGTNNIELNTPAEIAKGIKNLCAVISKKLPTCTIQVLGILPRQLPDKARATPSQVNALLHQELAGHESIHFHDISHLLMNDEGKLNTALFSDGLHPNTKGYAVIAKALKSLIR